MFKQIGTFFFIITIGALQTALSPRIAIFGVKPDLLLIALVVWGIIRGANQGGLFGLGAGLLEDILSSGYYIHTITKGISGFLSGIIRGSLSMAENMTYVVAVILMTFVGYFLEILSSYLFFNRQLPGFSSIIIVILIASLYNGLLTVIFSPVFSRVARAFIQDTSTAGTDFKLYRV